jgi:2,3-diaminopropionate biosynthesis protein SbnA
MFAKSPTDLVLDDVFIELREILPSTPVHLKLEGFSITGSMKIKPALRMIARLELEGVLRPGMKLVESSSGSLGVALSMVCAARGYAFTCVSDPNLSPQTARAIRAYGARLIIVHERDPNGGFLGSRIERIEAMLREDPELVWLNQYENVNNPEAHYLTTGPAILRRFPEPDFLFIGAGTTGTLGGVSRYFREHSPATRIVAVDSAGSVTFGFAPGRRNIPGLGTSRAPQIRHLCRFDEIALVPEARTVRMCHQLARRGLLLGGSTGTVLCAVAQLEARIPAQSCVVAISPDLGERYLDTVYNPAWIAERFPELAPDLAAHAAADELALGHC